MEQTLGEKVENAVIHRRIEWQAARHAEATAIVDADHALTYRELNVRANAVARELIRRGFRRGSHARVSLPRGCDLAVVLLAILKAGGSYSWPCPVSTIPVTETEATAASSPNLPVLVRPSDIACVLGGDPASGVLVPHATIASISATEAEVREWIADHGALDLWACLMSGGTLSVAAAPVLEAAA